MYVYIWGIYNSIEWNINFESAGNCLRHSAGVDVS